jgi:hypothetical protein
VKKANEKLLSSLPPVASAAFDYFRQVFLGLREDIAAENYKKTLEDYLSKFIALAEERPNTFFAGEKILQMRLIGSVC